MKTILNIITVMMLLMSFSGIAQNAKKEKTNKGSVEFVCTMCANKGKILIWGKRNLKKMVITQKEEGNYILSKRVFLPAGKYTYQYTDANNNLAKGSFKVEIDKPIKIRFFE